MDNYIIVALDYADKGQALALLSCLDPSRCRVKVGMQMFTLYGPDFVRQIIALGFDVFLDLKFHDIPQTVAKAVSAACDLGVWMLTVHTQGGLAMLQAAKDAVDQHPERSPILVGVTVLTSLDQEDLLMTIGRTIGTTAYACDLARLASQSGLDGVVCSAQEAVDVRASTGSDFVIVTPGIRLHSDSHDQKRVVTPQQAIENGADYIVVGRSITQADSPIDALASFY